MSQQVSRIEQTFNKLAQTSDALQRLRSKAFDELTLLKAPSKKDEAWKYTSPKSFLEAAWDVNSSVFTSIDSVVDLEKVPFAKLPSQATLLFVDGVLRSDLSRGSWSGSSLEKAPADLISKFENKPEFFERMNLALLNQGTYLEIDTRAAELPLILIYLSTKPATDHAVNYRLMIQVPTQAKASVIEVHAAVEGVSAASQIVTQVQLDANSSLTYTKVQTSSEAQHLSSTQFRLARDARLESTQIAFGGALTRHNLEVTFVEEGGEAVVNGLYLGCGNEHIDNRTLIDHAVGNTTSSQLYKGVLDDTARAVFTGGVRIRKDAQKANSSQLNNNLMLSQKAEIDTKPELEIDADDVKAAHGATIGQINPDHVFYLQSRALSRKQAVEMLAFGFAQDIVDRISDETARTELSKLVKHKFSSFKVNA